MPNSQEQIKELKAKGYKKKDIDRFLTRKAKLAKMDINYSVEAFEKRF